VLQAGGIELDTATRTVRQAGVPVELTSVEFGLLEVLLRSAGQVVTREKLAATVLGRKFAPFDRSIDMHVSKVRKKLGDTGGSEDLIKTVARVRLHFCSGALRTPRDEKPISAIFRPFGRRRRCLWFRPSC